MAQQGEKLSDFIGRFVKKNYQVKPRPAYVEARAKGKK